jgi:hypothetical protein
MTRGDKREITLTVTSNGSPLNLTGKRVLWAAKRSTLDAQALISKSSATSGITLTNPAGGIATVTLDPADTSGFPDTVVLQWDAQVDDNPLNPQTVDSGTLTVYPDVA